MKTENKKNHKFHFIIVGFFIIAICSISLIISDSSTLAAEAATTSTSLIAVPDTQIIVTATDNSSNPDELLYAINTKQESAFSKNNVFDVKKGNTYIVYVKDKAGNITSKPIKVAADGTVTAASGQVSETGEPISETSTINVTPYEDLDIIKNTPASVENNVSSSGSTAAGSNLNNYPNVISGAGTVIDTSGVSENKEKEFYTIQTKDEKVFFLVIDHEQSAENVYFLDMVTEDDLTSLTKDKEKETSFLQGNSKEIDDEITSDETIKAESDLETKENSLSVTEKEDTKQNTSKSKVLIIFIIAIISGGVYYYFKIYKPKQRLDDADDIEDFEVVDDEDDDVIEFDQESKSNQFDDDDEKDELEKILNDTSVLVEDDEDGLEEVEI